ncbi:hypothetical protein ACIBEJ_00610 [Nonomuraea sp. NPDC050790]|uniref:hypothetical protein n=1 Tax=Nonomuraea sp. NPDC050790 TaxID=3364371 RepID=UPI0037BAFBE5
MEVSVLRSLAEDRDLINYTRFSQVFREVANELGHRDLTLSPRQWDRWLSGSLKKGPHPRSRDVLAHIFGRPARELFSPAPPPGPARPADDAPTADNHGYTAHRAEGLYELMRDAADQSRQAAADVELALGEATLGQLHDDVSRLARTFLLRPPAVVFPELVAIRGQVNARMSQTRRPDQLTELNFLAGILSALLAEACIDLGQHTMAREHARAAGAYAASIDHGPLAIHARGLIASSSYWAGQPRDAVKAIQRAEELRPTGLTAARVYSVAARAWSHVGNTDLTIRSIRIAAQARAAAEDDDLRSIGGVFCWDEARQARSAATALLQLMRTLGADVDPAEARSFTGQVLLYAQQALTLIRAEPADERSPIVEAQIGIELATTHVLLGDLASAREYLDQAMSLSPNMRSFPVLHRLGGLKVLLVGVSTRTGRQLKDTVNAFAEGSTMRALPAVVVSEAARPMLPGAPPLALP